MFVGLETEGVEKFVEAWDDLTENVKKALGWSECLSVSTRRFRYQPRCTGG